MWRLSTLALLALFMPAEAAALANGNVVGVSPAADSFDIVRGGGVEPHTDRAARNTEARPAPADQECVYTLSQSSATFPPSGGSGQVSVSAPTGCAWTAFDPETDPLTKFLAVVAGAQGSGNGVVQYQVVPRIGLNYLWPARSGTLRIAGQSFVVNQEGTRLCTFLPDSGGAGIGASGGAGQFRVSAINFSQCSWWAVSHANWLTVIGNPGGQSDGVVTFVAAPNPRPVARSGTISVDSDLLTNTTLYTVAQLPATPLPAFGVIDTPTNRQEGVAGSLAVTGWVLDDVGIREVRILRDPVAGEGASLIPIGNATLVDGARPDIAAAYSGYPNSSSAGWGYLLLTNMLPNGGNGAFRLYVYADDQDGHSTLLGSRVIICTNGTATTPFGALDTPGQGARVSGIVNNFGWVLSPMRRADPPGGGTVTVFIDGAPVGVPGGWTNRSDLTGLFAVAQYPGVASALGVFTLDTSTMSNGVHTIAWGVTDSEGGSAGIGSRYFTVANGPGLTLAAGQVAAARSEMADTTVTSPMDGRRGFDLDAPLETFVPDTEGTIIVRASALDRIELETGAHAGYLSTIEGPTPLPSGSGLDADGTFTWHPGPVFTGAYDLVFETAEGVRRVRIVLEAKKVH